jgi:acetoin utilization protein AcuB
MLVRDRMSNYPITTTPDASVPDALKVMQGSKIRQLPVLNADSKLVGIVSLVDLFRVSPSPATSLTVWEIDYLLDKIKVETVMTKDVITVTEDTPLEEAGRILADNAISGLPVMRGGQLVGMITESHLFSILMELFGARRPGVRVMAKMPFVKGGLAKLAGAVAAAGGQFMSFGIHPSEDAVTFKVQDVEKDKLIEAIKPFVIEILDVRESKK